MILNHPPMPDNPYELRSIILSFLPPMPSSVRDSFRVWDCNKDMVLCGFWDLDYQDRERSIAFLVCNPFTKQWSALPVAPRKSVVNKHFLITSIAFGWCVYIKPMPIYLAKI
ncbi:unnamed protein product [Linum tenue]|uniref:Uncharacterized protein n=3 Tax=Linum tenue TaxID=586396 RepID=A0AAV0HGD7_9ROSI|nr:unnamed protein product [Linum tenue]